VGFIVTSLRPPALVSFKSALSLLKEVVPSKQLKRSPSTLTGFSHPPRTPLDPAEAEGILQPLPEAAAPTTPATRQRSEARRAVRPPRRHQCSEAHMEERLFVATVTVWELCVVAVDSSAKATRKMWSRPPRRPSAPAHHWPASPPPLVSPLLRLGSPRRGRLRPRHRAPAPPRQGRRVEGGGRGQRRPVAMGHPPAVKKSRSNPRREGRGI
jgi:hypothetical protein